MGRGHVPTTTDGSGALAVMRPDPAEPLRVLVVEDDVAVGSGLVGVLAADGYEVTWAQTGASARRLLEQGAPDLLLLDLGLPDEDGLTLCRDVHALHAGVVVVVVTARTSEVDAVRALDDGADDVVTKPVRPVELTARLRAHLRRREDPGTPELRVGPVRLDGRSRRAWVGSTELLLRVKEHELLTLLMASAGTAVSRETIMREVWDEHWHGSTKTLDVHVANVRRKLADAGDHWERITTLRGFGYRFSPEPETSAPGASVRG